MFKKLIMAYDHRVSSKYLEKIKAFLLERGISFEVVDDDGEENDYPILAKAAYDKFLNTKADGMILLCGTGVGMNIVANKCDGIRSVLPDSEGSAYFARRDENANCIVFAAGKEDENYGVKLCSRKMLRMLGVFLATEFLGEERHVRRISQIEKIERNKL